MRSEQECACRKALEKIRRIPTMPFPDPEAHSWRAFTDAVYRAYGDIQRTVNFALATPCECAGLKQRDTARQELAKAVEMLRVIRGINAGDWQHAKPFLEDAIDALSARFDALGGKGE